MVGVFDKNKKKIRPFDNDIITDALGLLTHVLKF